MKIGKHILIILALTYSINLFGSCDDEYFSITELLNHDPKNHHIFTCEILETYISGNSFESIAIVKRRYRGNPMDTIYIKTGGGTTAGGQKLYPKSEWLIFSPTLDSLHYGATVCDFLSSKLAKGRSVLCENDVSPLGKFYVEVLGEYESIKRNNFSGKKEIKIDGKLVAKGEFLLGQAHGDWIHYSRMDQFKNEIKRSEISYKDGMLHGHYYIYQEDVDNNVVIEKRIYHDDLPDLIEINRYHQTKYEYSNDSERVITRTIVDSLGTIQKQFSWIELDFADNNRIVYKHGSYLNKMDKDSSASSPLAVGKYFKGARANEWKFYNKKGDLIDTKMYPEEYEADSPFQVYDEQGNITLSGFFFDKKRTGAWKYYYDNKLEYEELYNSNGDKISKTSYYIAGGFAFTPYLNHLKHGDKIVFNQDHTIRTIEHYEKGRLEGRSIFFNDDGTIKKESTFIKAREFTSNKNSCYVSNGFLNDHHIQYHNETNKKILEGDYWNGYRTGVWLEYGDNGSFIKMYYPTEKEDLINQCGHAIPKLTEQFDKDGNLINTIKL